MILLYCDYCRRSHDMGDANLATMTRHPRFPSIFLHGSCAREIGLELSKISAIGAEIHPQIQVFFSTRNQVKYEQQS